MRGTASKIQGGWPLRNDAQGWPPASINHLNYPEDGEKLAKQVILRSEGWGSHTPKLWVKIIRSENSGKRKGVLEFQGKGWPCFPPKSTFCQDTSWPLQGRRCVALGTVLIHWALFFCCLQESRVRLVFIHRHQKFPSDLEWAMVSGSALVSSPSRWRFWGWEVGSSRKKACKHVLRP